MSARPILFVNARLVDPEAGTDSPGGLLVRDGVIADAGPQLRADTAPDGAELIDCAGDVLAPGLVDLRVFTGEPGSEYRETLESASRAAAAGGITTFAMMPNTDPPIDEPALVDFVLRRARDTAVVKVRPMAALTRGLAGETMAEIGLLQEAGAAGFTDADRSVRSSAVMRRALAYAATFDALVAPFAEDPDLGAAGVVTESEFAMRLGLPAVPAAAETIILERDMHLVALTGARYHAAQVSCAAALSVIDAAKRRGLPVTCAVSAHHLALNALDVGAYRTFAKTRPPLRAEEDRAAMAAALCEGRIDAVVSSHDPQAPDTKRLPFADASYGAAGLETLLPVVLGIVHDQGLPLAKAWAALSLRPAQILGEPSGRLARGAPADLIRVDPAAAWTVRPEALHSRSRNTPFEKRMMQGIVRATWVDGTCVFTRAGGS